MKFIDEVKIQIASGHGGPGAVSFRREAMVPRGGPDGGDGGKGGDIIFKTTPHLNSLMDFRSHKKYHAEDGHPGAGANMSGAEGKDLILLVPAGTVIRHESGEIIADLTNTNELLLLKGGRGGKGNTFFKTSVNQAPEHAQPGEDGEALEVVLELKLIADVGIIGFPNAGKSTLISRISAAKPKIADYPFTTLVPNLGVVKVGDYHSFVVADIPGLIEGASQGTGLGIQFLKHIERTNLFLHLVDVSGYSGRDPLYDYQTIIRELKAYDDQNDGKEGFRALSDRKQIVVLNKMDAISKEQMEVYRRKFEKILGESPRLISAVTGLGVRELILEVSRLIIKDEDKEEVLRDL
jgi:GTP-binding protein